MEKNKAGKWASGGRGYDSKWGAGEGLAEEDTEQSSEGHVEVALQAPGAGLQAEGMLTRW